MALLPYILSFVSFPGAIPLREEKIPPYRWIYGRGRTVSTVLLELTTNDDHAVLPIIQYEVPLECFVILFEPDKLHVELESGVFMTTCKLEYGDAKIYVDDQVTNLTLPK